MYHDIRLYNAAREAKAAATGDKTWTCPGCHQPVLCHCLTISCHHHNGRCALYVAYDRRYRAAPGLPHPSRMRSHE